MQHRKSSANTAGALEVLTGLDVLTRDVVDSRRGGLITKETSGRSGGA
jgi:hypothetical protein